MPPIVINIPPTDSLPGWVAPIIGLLGVLVGLIANNLFSYFDERRRFRRDMKLQLHLDLQEEEYELRRWEAALEDNQQVTPDWLAINRRWSSLLFRLGAFATPKVQVVGRDFYDAMHGWLIDAEKSTKNGQPDAEEKGRLQRSGGEALDKFSILYIQLRTDLKVPMV